ncbi:hypothetical protein V1527DRAFT_429583 [Lipomyces starkeyi]
MERSDLLETVRRPLSPDTRLEVPTSWEEYKRVDEILERDEAKYPQLWYDSVKGVAIVVAPPTPLHSGMAGALLTSIYAEIIMNSGISSEVTRHLLHDSDSRSKGYTSRGLTTRAWDGALQYREGKRLTLMIAVEVGVSQSYDNLRAAISWSVCALRCRLGLAMSISEGSRGEAPPMRYYESIEEANDAVVEAEDDFQDQLMQRPYGLLVRYGVTWFGRVRRVILETYRQPGEEFTAETLLEPSQSFTIVENGEYVGLDISPDLRDIVLGDCIPSHLLSGQEVRATPVNFFHREWFENQFGASIVRTAVQRVQDHGQHIH